MVALSQSPRALKGGFVVMDGDGKAVIRTIVFQFNPDSLTRRLTPAGAQSGAEGTAALRLTGPPQETLSFEIELDATDSSVAPGGPVLAPGEEGITADLALLEVLISPKVDDMVAGHEMAMRGALEILPLPSPLVLLVLGPNRVLPVRITDVSVTEEAFDTNLDPIRARLSIGTSVLTVDDLAWGTKGAELYMAALARREKRAEGKGGALSALGLSGTP
ncbi:hypothetical protein [Maritimibacter alexandrii]|uniref:hypothetical protein n=1 Tax=Maritimibacter alexandrii TaxID=2570355 RepID=UPI001107DBB0|nr:hypothetical protein [Maritimibacter alexandrii]